MDSLPTKLRVSRIFPLICIVTLFLLGLTACGTNAGLLHSTGGWRSSDLPKEHIHALTTDPNNPQRVYAGTDQGTVVLTTDGGTHWKEKTPVATAGANLVNALGFNADSTKLYAASDKWLAVSGDGGQSWQRLAAPSLPVDGYTALAFDLKTPAVLYLGTTQHGVLKSSDGGRSWQALTQDWPAGAAVKQLVYVTDQQQLWAATSRGMYRVSPVGSSWQALNTNLPAGVVVNAVAPLAALGGDRNTVLAGTERGFFISQDAGAHWLPSKDSLSVTGVTAILVDFRSSDLKTVYAGTGAGALQSTDQGQTWQAVADGLPEGVAVRALTLGATNNSQLFAGADTIYLYPGDGDGGGSTNYGAIIIFVALFALLYYFTQRGRRNRMDNVQRRMAAQLAEQNPKLSVTPDATPSLNGRTPGITPKQSDKE